MIMGLVSIARKKNMKKDHVLKISLSVEMLCSDDSIQILLK